MTVQGYNYGNMGSLSAPDPFSLLNRSHTRHGLGRPPKKYVDGRDGDLFSLTPAETPIPTLQNLDDPETQVVLRFPDFLSLWFPDPSVPDLNLRSLKFSFTLRPPTLLNPRTFLSCLLCLEPVTPPSRPRTNSDSLGPLGPGTTWK